MKTKAVKRILLTLVCGALTIALGACSGDKAGESSSQITIGIPQDIEDSLDPHKAVAAGTKEVLFNLYEGLVKPDSSGELQPAIASDYSISEDATTYTFTLREGVKFHDGSMVTAEDVKYSIDRCADTTNGEPLVEAYSNIKSVNIVDEKTVEVVLNTADSDFLANMTTAIIPASNENPDTNPIGTGEGTPTGGMDSNYRKCRAIQQPYSPICPVTISGNTKTAPSVCILHMPHHIRHSRGQQTRPYAMGSKRATKPEPGPIRRSTRRWSRSWIVA